MEGEKQHQEKSGAALVATGIFLSRIAGFVRESVFAHYFGSTPAADAFKGALRIPNLLQNLLGEGVLSATFIPSYVRLRAAGKEEDARSLAFAVFSFLALIASLVVAAGILASPFLVDVITPGFEGETRDLAIRLVRIFFPGAALLVLSSWCLGVLNSHGRFLLSYTAPVVWNIAIIAALVFFGRTTSGSELAIWVAWGVVAGSFLQFVVQLPSTFSLLRGFRLNFDRNTPQLGQVRRTFLPVLFGRGVTQISAFVDSMLASLAGPGGVAVLAYAQMIYLLPIGLFGMAVSAAELPKMSAAEGDDDAKAEYLRRRLANGSQQVLFFVAPSACVLFFFSDSLVTLVYQRGKFLPQDTAYVSLVLQIFALGLVPATLSRLYASASYAMLDAKTPLRVALKRITLSTVVAAAALYLDRKLGVTALALGSAIASFAELALLHAATAKKIGEVEISSGWMKKLFVALGLAAGAALIAKHVPLNIDSHLRALGVLTVFGGGFFAMTLLLGFEQAAKIGRKLGLSPRQ